MSKKMSLASWQLTPWEVNVKGGWEHQPVLIVQGRTPFFASHPSQYIQKLQELHDDPTVARGPFYAYIGQFKDAMEQVWNSTQAEQSSATPHIITLDKARSNGKQ